MAAFKTGGFISATIVQWAQALDYDRISPEAVRSAKLFLFDSFACALGGSEQERPAHHDRAPARDGGKPDCTGFVSGFKTNPVDAALLNALMIRAMVDKNDTQLLARRDPQRPLPPGLDPEGSGALEHFAPGEHRAASRETAHTIRPPRA